MTDAESTERADAGPGDGGELAPDANADDAFAALGNDTRLRVLRTLADADEPPTFTELFEASDEETSAGFAYHLRQLVDRFVRKDEETERYRLTYAGRQAARALAAGTYTEQVTRDPEPIEGDCPVCGEPSLEARVADNFVAVACTGCGTELLSLPFPPSGSRDRDAAETAAAFDAHHRHRFGLLAEGVCPDCAGRAGAEITFVETPALPGDERRPVLAGRCSDCDFRVRAPVSLAVTSHPEAVAFFREHGGSIRDRPIWNLGSEWSETVLSEDPPAVRVRIRLGGETLGLLVGDGPTVVDVERVTVDEGSTDEEESIDKEGPIEEEGSTDGEVSIDDDGAADADRTRAEPGPTSTDDAEDYDATAAGSS
ncbi:DUF7351 domain-containing protein [Halorarum halobium]|uniref:DUF7351 domain-containing protein n=1 Tax=Halorarum halobium TaxID=3075121 RepID=UPI0028A9E336|nr:ArsR family transcriptional regulator [Halobaculum sp. XH14]